MNILLISRRTDELSFKRSRRIMFRNILKGYQVFKTLEYDKKKSI